QWGGGEPLNGTVRRVEPYGFTKFSALGVEEQRVNVIVDFDDPREAWKALGDGYRVEVRIVVWEDDDVLKVPTSSLFRRGEDWAVYAVEGGRAVLRVVRIGRRDGLAAQVLDGLAEGESVIVHPSDAIEDGVAVVERSV
ncbi:MAG TPA: efflux transporter periplasmic adaptor subunit, partial [Thermoanaerobaculia bacterium]